MEFIQNNLFIFSKQLFANSVNSGELQFVTCTLSSFSLVLINTIYHYNNGYTLDRIDHFVYLGSTVEKIY